MLLKSLLLIVAISASSVAETPASRATKPKTATEVASRRAELSEPQKPFTLKIRVQSSDRISVSSADGSIAKLLRLRPDLDHSGTPEFTVHISTEVETRLKTLGIRNLEEYLQDAIIELRGTVSRVPRSLIGSETTWFYHVGVDALDQVISVTRPKRTTAKRK